jgi:hypothetical protein
VSEAREQAAVAFGVGARDVSDAKRIREEAPDLFAAVKAGETTIPEATREATRRERAYSARNTAGGARPSSCRIARSSRSIAA